MIYKNAVCAAALGIMPARMDAGGKVMVKNNKPKSNPDNASPKKAKAKSKQAPKADPALKEPKPPKIRNLRVMTVMRNLFFVLGICIFAMGIFVIVRMFTRGDGTQILKAEMSTEMTSIRKYADIHTEARAFAQNFIKDYFTYESQQADDYKKRLEKYCSPKLASDIAENLVIRETADATYVQAVEISEYGKYQYDITVMAEVCYTKRPVPSNDMLDIGASGIPENEMVKNTFYLIVPVWSDEQGGYVIEDMPMLTSPVKAIEAQRHDPSGNLAEDQDKVAAQQMLSDFFRTLYTEPKNKIDYYLSDDADKQKFAALELGGSMTFDRIDSLALYKLSSANEFIGVVSIRIADVNGTEIRQRFNIRLIKKDKFYAKDINPRTYNLKV